MRARTVLWGVWVVLCGVLSLGCLYGQDVVMDETPLSPVRSAVANGAPVPVYLTGEPTGRPYVEVFRLTVLGARKDNIESLLPVMARQGGFLGADAVVIVSRERIRRREGEGVADLLHDLSSNKDKGPPPSETYRALNLEGIAIVYEDNAVEPYPQDSSMAAVGENAQEPLPSGRSVQVVPMGVLEPLAP